MKKIFFSLILCLTIFITSHAATITVCASGCDHTTIAAAITGASANDVIEVQDAVHTETNIQIDKDLTIQGQGMNNTIVQAHASPGGSSLGIFYATSVNVTFQNMTLRHGSNPGSGGAASPINTSSPNYTFINCLLTENQANQGGVVYTQSGNIIMTDCIVTNNSANIVGGAVLTTVGNCTYTRCTFSGNTALLSGGAIYNNGSHISFENCTIYDNSLTNPGSTGGGVSILNAGSLTMTNCTISDNTAPAGSLGVGLSISTTNAITLINNIIANSTGGSDLNISNPLGTPSYSNNLVESCSGSCPGGGFAFTSDPNLGTALTCSSGHSILPLQSPSDAIDGGTATGTPANDQCGTARSGATDIGAAEFSAGGTAIPTMGEWALLIFGLIILSLATVYVMRWSRRLSPTV